MKIKYLSLEFINSIKNRDASRENFLNIPITSVLEKRNS